MAKHVAHGRVGELPAYAAARDPPQGTGSDSQEIPAHLCISSSVSLREPIASMCDLVQVSTVGAFGIAVAPRTVSWPGMYERVAGGVISTSPSTWSHTVGLAGTLAAPTGFRPGESGSSWIVTVEQASSVVPHL